MTIERSPMQDLLELIQAVVNSADDNGGHDLLVPRSAIEALADYAKQKKYVADNGEDCPHCSGDMEVVGDLVRGIGGIVWQESKCCECDRIIDDTYHLVGYADIDPNMVASK